MGREGAGAADVGNECMKLIDSLVAVEQVQPTKVLSKLRLDANLDEVVLKQHAVVLTHKPTWQRQQ